MELTAIIAGLPLTAGGLVVLGGPVLRAGMAHRRDLLRPATHLASRLPRWPGGSPAGVPGFRRLGRVPAEGALGLSLILGLAAVALAAAGVGKLVDDVTDGDGVAVLDHPVGLSRVYLGVHWTTDVIGGWMFGILWMAVVVSGRATFGHLPHPGP